MKLSLARFAIALAGLVALSITPVARAQTVAYYRFEDGTPGSMVTTVTDSGPNHLNGTSTGTTPLYYSASAPNLPGRANKVSLDARGDYNYISVPPNPVLEVQGDLTVEAFVRLDSPYVQDINDPYGDTFVSDRNTLAGGNFLYAWGLIYHPQTGQFRVAIGYGSGDTGTNLYSSGVWFDSNWHEVAFVLARGNPDTLTLYVDGVQQGQATGNFGNLRYGDNNLLIGAGNYATADGTGYYRRNFDGYIDEVRITAAALRPNQFLGASEGSWTALAPMPTARFDLVAVTDQSGLIYAINGRTQNGSSAFHLMEIYNPATNSWTTGTPPSDGHYGGRGVLGNDGNIYLMGGYYQDPTVEAYNPSTGQWTTLASMPQGRFGFAAVTGVDGRIYTFGGDIGGGGANVNTAEAYDPPTNTWTTLASMPFALIGPGVAVGTDNRIYVIGGGSNGVYSTEVLIYDPILDAWSDGGPMFLPRSNLSVVADPNGLIYAIGGEQSVGGINAFDAYDSTSQTWAALPSLPAPRLLTGATEGLDGRLYVFGGTDDITPAFNTAFAYTPGVITVSSQLQVGSSGPIYNRGSKLYTGSITLKNISQQAINGPLQVVLTNLTSGVTLANAVGTFLAAPYVTANITTLAPGATVTLPVQFSDPNNARIGYTVVTYAGSL
jgi:N-acetylneuraminic acid mutarotase